MGKVVVMNWVTLDGVMQGPGRPGEDTRVALPTPLENRCSTASTHNGSTDAFRASPPALQRRAPL